MFKLSLSTWPTQEYKDFEQCLHMMNHYGVGYMELMDWGCIPVLDGSNHRMHLFENIDFDELERLLQAYGVRVGCIHYRAAFEPDILSDLDMYYYGFKNAIDAAVKTGCFTVLHYNCLISPGENHNMEELHRYFDIPLKYAEQKNVTLVLENEARDSCRSPEAMKELIEAFNSIRFKTAFDPTNYYQAGYEPYPYAYGLLKEHIAYVHLKDGCVMEEKIGHSINNIHPFCRVEKFIKGVYKGKNIYYPPMGCGAVNNDSLIAAMKSDGLDVVCNLEPHVPAGHLEACLDSDMHYLSRRGFELKL